MEFFLKNIFFYARATSVQNSTTVATVKPILLIDYELLTICDLWGLLFFF